MGLLATFNVNNVNKHLPNLLKWLEERAPDIVCLQELKAAQDAFPATALAEVGYGAVWKGQRTWNGVAILARGATPTIVRDTLPGDPSDDQSRYIEAAVNGILVGCLYLPNGNPQPGPKFDYKLAWFARLIGHARKLYATKAPVVLAGDYNVVPTDDDIYSPKSWKRDALLQPESRAAYRRLLAQGWLDVLKKKYPKEQVFTFWDYFRNHWSRNAGLRIDHILLNAQAAALYKDAGVDRDVRGEPSPSDHAPVWVKLARQGNKRATRSPKVKRAGAASAGTKARRKG
jgi:exodeoxyribonuclease-3